MSDKKKDIFDRKEYEQLMKKLERAKEPADREADDPDYFNPWSMTAKTKRKSRFFAKLPDELN